MERLVEDVCESLQCGLGMLYSSGNKILGLSGCLVRECLCNLSDPVVGGLGDGLEQVQRGGGLADAEDCAAQVLVPSGGPFGTRRRHGPKAGL